MWTLRCFNTSVHRCSLSWVELSCPRLLRGVASSRIWTRDLLITSPTPYRCTTASPYQILLNPASFNLTVLSILLTVSAAVIDTKPGLFGSDAISRHVVSCLETWFFMSRSCLSLDIYPVLALSWAPVSHHVSCLIMSHDCVSVRHSQVFILR